MRIAGLLAITGLVAGCSAGPTPAGIDAPSAPPTPKPGTFSDAGVTQADAEVLPPDADGGGSHTNEQPLLRPEGSPGPAPFGNGSAPRPCTGALATGVAVLCVHPREPGRSSSIQGAIDAAKDGDVIQVAGGTYLENVTINGKALALLGGFSPDFSARALASHETTLRGDGTASTLQIAASGKANTVDGLTITGGGGNPSAARSGAGVYVENGTTTISNNRIVANRVAQASIHMTDTRGGGIVANGESAARVIIVGNAIEGNVSGRGAGIASTGMGSIVIRSNVVRNNRGYSDHGGGLFISSHDALITGNLVEGNQIGPASNPYGYGGGIYVFEPGSVARLAYNVVTNNVAVTVGSGVFIDNGAHASLDHEVIFGNRCTQAGGSAIAVDSTDESDLSRVTGSIVTIAHTTVTGHACATENHGDGILIGGYRSRATVTTSIFVDNGPAQFNLGRSADAAPAVSNSFTSGDPKFAGPLQHDFHLQPDSPAKGLGAL